MLAEAAVPRGHPQDQCRDPDLDPDHDRPCTARMGVAMISTTEEHLPRLPVTPVTATMIGVMETRVIVEASAKEVVEASAKVVEVTIITTIVEVVEIMEAIVEIMEAVEVIKEAAAKVALMVLVMITARTAEAVRVPASPAITARTCFGPRRPGKLIC